MYQILLAGSNEVIYDQSQMNSYSVKSPGCSFELNEAGSLRFTLYPGHPLYNSLEPIASYVVVLDDGEEIFYGRVLNRSKPLITGEVNFQCEGALSFLLDSEIKAYGKNSRGQQTTRHLTAQQFFEACIQEHNTFVNDPRRQFTVGIVNAAKKDTAADYSISRPTKTKDAIESEILNIYGGFIRIRQNGSGGHYIDWIQDYEDVNPQAIEIGVNLEEQTNESDGSSMFTVLRPIGANGLVLPEDTIDLYEPADMAKYGKIIKSVDFSSATTVENLRSQANEYKSRIEKTLFESSSIRLVDMHYLDGTYPKVRIGARFTNIVGYSGITMIATSLELEFEAPQNDSLSLKNRKSLDPDLTPEGNGHKGGSLSRGSKASQSQVFKWLKEQGDILEVLAPQVYMHGDTLEAHYESILVTSNLYERLSRKADELENTMEPIVTSWHDVQYTVEQIAGTGVIQNDQFITNLAGKFEIWTDNDGNVTVHLKDGAEMAVDDQNGGTITVGTRISQMADTIGDHQVIVDAFEGSALWTQRDNITAVCGEYDVQYERVEEPPGSGNFVVKKTLVVKSGGGLKIRRDGSEFGLYDTGNLTGGIMVQKINNQVETKISGDVVDISASQVKLNATDSLSTVVGHFVEEDCFLYDDQGHPIVDPGTGVPLRGKRLVYRADAGMIVEREQDGITTRYGLYDEGNLTGGVMVQKINEQTVTSIHGDKIIIGNVSGNDLDTWAADKEGLIAAKASIASLDALTIRVGTLESTAIKTDNLQSRIGDIDQLLVKRIAGSTVSSDAFFDQFVGHHFYLRLSGGGNQSYDVDLIEGIRDIQIVPPTGTSNEYKLQKKAYNSNNWVDAGTFSRATQLSGTWSGDTLTVGASPQGNEYTIGFGTGKDQRIGLYTNGAPTLNANNVKRLDVPLKLCTISYVSSSDPNHLTTRHEEVMTVDATPVFTEGETSGKNAIGLSGPTWDNSGNAYGYNNWKPSSRTISVSTTGKATNVSKSQWIGFAQDSSWASDHTKKVYVVKDNANGSRMMAIEVDASSVFTEGETSGKNAIGLSGPTWDNSGNAYGYNNWKPSSRTISVSTTGKATNVSKSQWIGLDQDSNWASNHIKKAYIVKDSWNGSRMAAIEIDASSVFTDGETSGKNAIGLTDPSWDNGGNAYGYNNWTPTSRTVTVSTTGKATNIRKEIWIGVEQDANWSANHIKHVYVLKDNWNGARMIGVEIDASDVYSEGETNGIATGKAAVGLSDPAWDNAGNAYGYSNWKPTSRSITVSTTGKATNISKTQWIGIEQDANWSSGTKNVGIYRDNWPGNGGVKMAGLTVDVGSFSFGSAMSTSSSEYSNVTKAYTMSKGYRYGLITVSIAGKTARIQVRLTD